MKLRVGMEVLEVRPYLTSIPSLMFDASSCIWTKHRQRSGATQTPAHKQPVSQSSLALYKSTYEKLNKTSLAEETLVIGQIPCDARKSHVGTLSHARCKDVQACLTRCYLITFTKPAQFACMANRSLPDLYKALVLCLHQARGLTEASLDRSRISNHLDTPDGDVTV
jgi:hypothetical protein